MNKKPFDPDAHDAVELQPPSAYTHHVNWRYFEGFEHGDRRFESPENVKRVLDFIDQHLK